jgi:hypothetical protein
LNSASAFMWAMASESIPPDKRQVILLDSVMSTHSDEKSFQESCILLHIFRVLCCGAYCLFHCIYDYGYITLDTMRTGYGISHPMSHPLGLDARPTKITAHVLLRPFPFP